MVTIVFTGGSQELPDIEWQFNPPPLPTPPLLIPPLFIIEDDKMECYAIHSTGNFFFFAAYCGILLELTTLFVCLSCLLLPACPPNVGGRQ